MAKKVGVIRFLGTNCDFDILKWVQNKGQNSEFIWHEDQFNTQDFEALILPGGFSYGDYLRCGALAARSPVMKSVHEFAKQGKPVLGICNGFQILCEAGLLPGALIRNDGLRFKDEWAQLRVVNQKSYFGEKLNPDQKIQLPIAHGDGRFYADAETFKKIQDQNCVWLKYEKNPNGSMADIAGVTNVQGNVFGLMPHPERAQFSWMGSTDGDFFL